MFFKNRSLIFVCIFLVGQMFQSNVLLARKDDFLSKFQGDIYADCRPLKYSAIKLFNEWKSCQHFPRDFDSHYQEASIYTKIAFFFLRIFPFIVS